MKSWYLSKTLWVNLLALLATWVIGRSDFYVNPQVMIVGMAVLNVGLRFFTTTAIAHPYGESNRSSI
jgi:hypothetical protein